MSDAIQRVIRGEFDKALANMQALAADSALQLQLEEAAAMCMDALRAGRKLLFCGNGGSAADAQHWAGELVSRFYYDRPGLAAIALTTGSLTNAAFTLVVVVASSMYSPVLSLVSIEPSTATRRPFGT